MRKIKYKKADTSEFTNYIDIGSCERDYYCINFFSQGEQENKSGKQNFESYQSWFENFKNEPIGAKMIILNYYLIEYMGWNISENSPRIDYFKEVYGDKIASVISTNLDLFLEFNNKWFVVESSIFKGLDLNWDDIEESIISTKENEDGIIEEIEFDDNSSILFLDEDDNIRSFFVAEEDFLYLKNEVNNIINKFQPN
jgi:hypothetical protein